jgi:hypothetical protein
MRGASSNSHSVGCAQTLRGGTAVLELDCTDMTIHDAAHHLRLRHMANLRWRWRASRLVEAFFVERKGRRACRALEHSGQCLFGENLARCPARESRSGMSTRRVVALRGRARSSTVMRRRLLKIGATVDCVSSRAAEEPDVADVVDALTSPWGRRNRDGHTCSLVTAAPLRCGRRPPA